MVCKEWILLLLQFIGVSGGKMINPSIGYRIKYYNLKMSLAVGYKFQRIFYKTNYYGYYCPSCNYIAFSMPAQSEITQDFNRLQVILIVGWK